MKKGFAVIFSLLLSLLSVTCAWASPLTGDTSHMGLWIAMVGVAILAVVIILILLRKKSK